MKIGVPVGWTANPDLQGRVSVHNLVPDGPLVLFIYLCVLFPFSSQVDDMSFKSSLSSGYCFLPKSILSSKDLSSVVILFYCFSWIKCP